MATNGSTAFDAFGKYLRSQRQLARLTLRELSEITKISNPYLSQIERGLHQPSIKVIKSLADALNLSAEAMLAQAAGLDDDEATPANSGTEAAIRADGRLSESQKQALLSVYRSFLSSEPVNGDTSTTTAPKRKTAV
ncbi:MAG TPA: helix-turn-helix transcriptional regulator [Acidimicrobiales bacterium]|nr:helix-turn-helix transcriptional regulator [Acidimicrobiales bacterium]